VAFRTDWVPRLQHLTVVLSQFLPNFTNPDESLKFLLGRHIGIHSILLTQKPGMVQGPDVSDVLPMPGGITTAVERPQGIATEPVGIR
jgi:hypothetical protein